MVTVMLTAPASCALYRFHKATVPATATASRHVMIRAMREMKRLGVLNGDGDTGLQCHIDDHTNGNGNVQEGYPRTESFPWPLSAPRGNEAVSELSMENRPHKDKRERSGGTSRLLVYAERETKMKCLGGLQVESATSPCISENMGCTMTHRTAKATRYIVLHHRTPLEVEHARSVV